MKVGDLVRLKHFCLDGYKVAIIVEIPDPEFGLRCAKILFLDCGKKAPAVIDNLEVISESPSRFNIKSS